MSNATEIAPELDGITKSRLVRALLIKSFLEIIIVCGAISSAAFFYFNPTIRGAITQADAVSVRGWVSNPSTGQTPLELFIDGRFVASVEITSATPAFFIRGFNPLDAADMQHSIQLTFIECRLRQ
jgi:hypothetical protein